ncbi:polysaccharide biosynthesis tyrosine autokinase [Rhodococcus sp. F64268]|uniref:polysaccharide biosynthesis tyrosine autokinase n=1 Tax=Rhodococcus sp. F64268 TaxID=2926402 RepID=UPI001FF625E0|nr:polysaccharide biosynthesis tyrosine autokinase [Rhodococcus sp. F64268]MCK0090475.1 polysaccharide biosynthesis tyrosine autokinase [Rhodococcus sp. F64268]
MEVHDYLRILQARWKIVAVTTVVAVLAALGASLLTTPQYEAKTRMFVSTSSGGSVQEIYQGNLFSQQRVASYTKLLTGTNLAERTIDTLGFTDMTPNELASKVTAASAPDTVLIDMAVTDPSPERARDIANAMSDEFVTMVRELETPENGGPPTARVVVETHAATPAAPVTPKTMRNVALGLAVGVLLGIALAVLRDRLDNTVKDREAIEEIAGAGVVGVIPMDKARQDTPPISFVDANSGDAEAYREMRTNLQFLEVDHPPRSIVVTSALPTEGKTTTAINLALVLTEAGHTVALVEGDLRRPRVSKYLGVMSGAGLSTVLANQASIADVMQTTKYDGLWVLGAGALPPNPSELLGSDHARDVLDDLRSRFDYVIIDAPPLLPVTDAAVLSTITDGALLIARHGKTTKEQLFRAVGNLRAVNATVLGTILNMTPAKGRGGSYEYRYYYETDKPADVSATTTAAPVAAQRVVNPPVPQRQSEQSPRRAVPQHQEGSDSGQHATPEATQAMPYRTGGDHPRSNGHGNDSWRVSEFPQAPARHSDEQYPPQAYSAVHGYGPNNGHAAEHQASRPVIQAPRRPVDESDPDSGKQG